MRIKIGSPNFIMLLLRWIKMHISIYFDGELILYTKEIEHIRSDWMLASKFQT